MRNFIRGSNFTKQNNFALVCWNPSSRLEVKMSFENDQIVVYNLYGQKVCLKIITKPNCFGYVDLLQDEVGVYVMKHMYTQALRLHHPCYSARFVDKKNRGQEWHDLHSSDKCEVCRLKKWYFDDLGAVPNWRLNELFGDRPYVIAPLREHKLPLLPRPDPEGVTIAKLPSDTEVIMSLRHTLYCQRISQKIEKVKFQAEKQKMIEQKEFLEKEKEWYRVQNVWGDSLIWKYHAILQALPAHEIDIVRDLQSKFEKLVVNS